MSSFEMELGNNDVVIENKKKTKRKAETTEEMMERYEEGTLPSKRPRMRSPDQSPVANQKESHEKEPESQEKEPESREKEPESREKESESQEKESVVNKEESQSNLGILEDLAQETDDEENDGESHMVIAEDTRARRVEKNNF